jgi:hypothetical protein
MPLIGLCDKGRMLLVECYCDQLARVLGSVRRRKAYTGMPTVT